jgi:hypothetical protein
MSKGPRLRWFVARALDGWAPKLALLDAILATLVAIFAAAVWRAGSGPRGTFEQIVPMLGTGLRWSVALPIAWGALGAIDADRKAGLLELARRRKVSARRWILGRAFGAATLVSVAVGAPMIVVSLVLAGYGGGLEGVLARLSLVVPSLFMGMATGCVFGAGAVVIGTLSSSRALAVGGIVAAAALGALVDLATPGLLGAAAHQIVSPFLALEDLQAALFDVPHSRARGVSAAVGILVFVFLGVQAATMTFEHERERSTDSMGRA